VGAPASGSVASGRISDVIRSPRLSGPVAWTAGVGFISVLYMGIVVPLGLAPDETEHAFRAYQLSLGHLFPQVVDCFTHRHLLPCHGRLVGHLLPKRRAGGELSYALVRVLNGLYGASHSNGMLTHFHPRAYTRVLDVALGGPAMAFAHFENTALYSPVNYAPATLVLWIARQAAEPVVASLFAARLLTGMVWLTLVTAAVALAPRWKWLFALVLLVPTALSQGAAISADSAALGVVALAVAYALNLADRGGLVRDGEVALMAVLGVVIGLMKFPLVLVLAAVLALLFEVLGKGRARSVRVLAIAGPGAAASVLWNLASNAYFVPYRNVVYDQAQRAYISQPGQEHYLLTHFYDIPAILWQTAVGGKLFEWRGVVGTVGEMGLPEWFGIAWLVLFVILAAASIEGAGPSRAARRWVGGTLLTYVLATLLALYLTWSSVGASEISGMHGRYVTLVLVLAIPLLAGIGTRHVRISPRVTAGTVMALSLASALAMCFYTSSYYYGQSPWTAFANVISVLF